MGAAGDGDGPPTMDGGVNPWATCLPKEPSKPGAEATAAAAGGGVGGGAPETSPVAAAQALFGRGAAMEGGLASALDAEALLLRALVPST